MTVTGHSNVFRSTKIDGCFEKETIHLGETPPQKWNFLRQHHGGFNQPAANAFDDRGTGNGKHTETVVIFLGYQGDLLQKL